MKIFSYIRDFPGKDDYQRDYSQILIELAKQGHEVTVVTLAFEQEEILDVGNVKVIRYRSDCPWIPSSLRCHWLRIVSAQKAARHLRAHVADFDVFFGVEWWNVCAHLLLRTALAGKLGCVLSVWDSFNPYSLNREQDATIQKKIALHLLKWSYAFQRKPILKMYSRQETENAVRMGFSWPLQIAPLGIYPDYGVTPSAKMPDSLQQLIPRDWRLLFFNARLDIKRKGMDFFIAGFLRAMQRMGPAFRVMLVVSGREPASPLQNQRAWLERIMLPIVQAGHGLVLGDLSEQDRCDWMAHCDMFLYPSRNDGPPRPIRQVVSYGTPLMITYETGMGTHAETHGAGIVIREISVAAAESAVETFNALEVDDLQKMRRGARQMADSLQWPVVAKKYEEIFRLSMAHARRIL